jgi:two-component system nitrogen regulation sensor histidine kinase NtrY
LVQVLVALLFVVGSLIYLSYSTSESKFRQTASCIESVVADSQEKLRLSLDKLKGLNEEEVLSYFNEHESELAEKGLSFFMFEGTELKSWSTSAVPEPEMIPEHFQSGPCILLANGWYLIDKVEHGNRHLYGLFLIKHEYHYQNRYLVNDFHSCFPIKEHPQILFAETEQTIPIYQAEGDVLFYMAPESASSSSKEVGVIYLFLLIVFLFFFIKYFFRSLFDRSSSFLMLFGALIALLILRAIVLWSGPFELLSSLELFNPRLYRYSLWYPSLGDLALNGFILLMLSYSLKEWISARDEGGNAGVVILLLLGYFFLARSLDDLFKELIQGSEIGFNISNFFDLDIYSVIGILSVSAMLLAMLFLAQAILRLLGSSSGVIKANIWTLSVLGLLVIAMNHLLGVVDMVKVLWPWVILIYLMISRRLRIKGPRLVYILGALVILSLYSTHMFEKYVVKKDREQLEVVAERLMEGEDQVAEMLFYDMRGRMLSDSLLWEMASQRPMDEERMLTQFRQEYFNGYWTKYEIDIEATTIDQVDRDWIEDMQDSLGLGFNRISEQEIGLNYVLKADLDTTNVLLVLFELNIIPEDLGFPELLMVGDRSMSDDLSRYSFAQYHQRELIDFYGDFDYRLKWMEDSDTPSRYFQERGYWHFPFDRGQDTYIISTPRKSFIDRLTTFTYLFCFLGFMVAMAYLIEAILIERRWPRFDLQYKVQALVVSVLFISLFVFGLGAYYYILSQHRANNEGILSEKVSSVLIELGHKLEKEQAMGDKEKMELYLDKFAKVFFTDINLYQLDGQLMASSRPQVFNRGLISERMDPHAFEALKYRSESRYIHEESIGGLDYLSAYVPFMDSEKNVLAYLNLPYFARQTELEDELSRFLVTVVNVLVLLFVLSILVAVLISNWITRPLQMLKDNLAAIQLDQTNKPIEYSGSDEIASLVSEYNTKVEELQRNAELLAKSERESAWREMAKQVAHEIKNPLTPMKLSIQYLQRSQADKGPEWEDRFQRSTDMLIEQIDTLSAIATAFSDFAQMPKAKNEAFDLSLLVEQVVDLFSEEPKVELYLENKIQGEAQIMADRDQMTRVLTNLIKNAIQSIPDEEEGKVVVELMAKGFKYIIEVRDNGIGIPEEMHEKIFVPNFTTKSTGTGLGLAMSKNIVEQAGGEIWFTTKEGQGTSFFVSLPLPDDS